MSPDPSFRMSIEDVFAIRGRGTVVVGQVESGMLQIGDVVKIETQVDTIETIVTGIEKFRRRLKQASAGENVGVFLRDVTKEAVQRGDVLIGTGNRSQF
jgi:elongation factor Tu